MLGDDYADSTLYEEEVYNCDTQYEFTINDSFGDGICCGYGDGEYEVKKDGVVVASGSSFGSSESTKFGTCTSCVDATRRE